MLLLHIKTIFFSALSCLLFLQIDMAQILTIFPKNLDWEGWTGDFI